MSSLIDLHVQHTKLLHLSQVVRTFLSGDLTQSLHLPRFLFTPKLLLSSALFSSLLLFVLFCGSLNDIEELNSTFRDEIFASDLQIESRKFKDIQITKALTADMSRML